MRLYVGFPLKMWEEAINTIVYLINKGPSTALGCGIPKEGWTSKKVSYSFLKNFGCEAFSHIDSEIEPSWKLSQRNVYLLDMELMNLVLGFEILKIIKL